MRDTEIDKQLNIPIFLIGPFFFNQMNVAVLH